MKETMLEFSDVARLAYCLLGGLDKENRIDFACSIDHDHRSVSEWSTIGKVNFFDSPAVLVGGFGGWVEAVSLIEFSFEYSRVVRPASCLMEILMHEGQPRGIRRRVTASWRACHCLEI